uniref:Uncharacterized protein n=1 Tax=Paramormyrops kingsleyae TaxID=1676925 RepID=A0A3B3QL38_9TELE
MGNPHEVNEGAWHTEGADDRGRTPWRYYSGIHEHRNIEHTVRYSRSAEKAKLPCLFMFIKLSLLEMTADGLERVHFRTTVGCLTGGVVGAAGGVTSIVGLILAPFTLGASLIVTGVGIGVSVAGWTTSAVSNITNMVNQSKERKTIEETISEYRDKMEPILMSVEDIRTGIEKLKEHESYTNAANMAQTASRAGRGLGGIAELVRLTQVVNIGRVAAQAARVVRVAEVFTGVLSAVFIALDVYFIVKDAKEIHSIRQGSQQQNEIKSATMKLVANIREMVSHFEENLAQLESMRKQIQTEG